MPLEIRKATLGDIRSIAELVNSFAAKGIMLPRTEFELAESIRDFTVALEDGKLLGCGALHIYTPVSGEVRSLAVHSDSQRYGVGREVVEALVREAEEFGLSSLFAFTYVPGFFSKLGFAEVDRGKLPLKAWKDCLKCPKFQACDEIAVLKYINSNRINSFEQAQEEPVILPVIRSAPEKSLPKYT